MIKISISHWKLTDMIKANEGLYNALRQYTLSRPHVYDSPLPEIKHKKNDKGEDVLDIGWSDFSAFINSPEDISSDYFPYIEWKPIEPLNMLTKDGGLRKESIISAMERNQIRLPDNTMLQVRTVKALDNACSDTLQTELNDGWRIIACCPQPGQRRPDYVLGRL